MPKNVLIKSGSGRAGVNRSWKTTQSNLKVRKKTQLALLVLGLILSLVIIAQAVRFIQTLISPWGLSEERRSDLWNGQFNINLVIESNPISVLSYHPQAQSAMILTVPDNVLIDVPFGFGKWQIRSIRDLGESSGLSGDLLLKDSIETFLGIPIDAVLRVEDNPNQKALYLIDYVRKSPLSGIEILPNIRTNLTPWELLRLKLGLMQVRFDKIKHSDLLNLNVLEKESLHDGTQVYITDPVRVDSILSNFLEPALQRESLTIAVFNGTYHPQLAQKAKRLIVNLGGNVIITANSEKKIEKTRVLGEKSETLKKLSQIFDRCNLDNTCSKINLNDLGLDSSRAQINVVLGEDFFK